MVAAYGFTCRVEQLEAQVGGHFRMAFTHFGNGNSHAFGGEYLELEPGKRIRYTDRFDDPNLPGVMHVTVILTGVVYGTELAIVQEGIPRSSRWRCATSAGRSRWPSWPLWWSPKSRRSNPPAVTPKTTEPATVAGSFYPGQSPNDGMGLLQVDGAQVIPLPSSTPALRSRA